MIKTELAKKTQSGDIYWYRFQNKNGLSMTVTNYGATITSIKAPDREGKMADVVLGYDDIEPYIAGTPFFGCTAGRYANRIGGAKFSLDGVEYALTPNENGNQLHGGAQGFDKRVWRGEVSGDALTLTYVSEDGEEGYPGKLTTRVTFRLTENNAVDISYEAETDAPTVLNLTNHSYFNLAGGGDILSHELTLAADSFAPTDELLIPTGEIRGVEGSPMDFRAPRKIGERVNETDYDAIKICGGYDNNYILNGSGMRSFATLYDQASGRLMEAQTDQPAVQLYTGQSIAEGTPSRDGGGYAPFSGVCLETQIFPDTPNHPEFGSAVLRPGERYTHRTSYTFLVR